MNDLERENQELREIIQHAIDLAYDYADMGGSYKETEALRRLARSIERELAYVK